MASQKLTQAIAFLKAGNKEAAFPLLRQLIQEEPNNDQVWLWMYVCVDRAEQKKYCLQKALEINPNNNDVRKVLDKLSGNIPTPTPVEPTRPKIQQSPVYQQLPAARPQRGTLRPHSKKQPASNRNMLLIGGAIVALFLCVSVGFGGSWIYRSYFASEQPYANEPQGSSPDNNPMNTGNDPTNPNQGADDGGPFPTPIIVEPGNESTPTVTGNGAYDIRLIPVSYTKTVDENDPQWSNLAITFAMENYSRETILSSRPSTKVKTQQGFEYECSTGMGSMGSVPPNFRTKLFIDFCHVPTESSGYSSAISIEILTPDLKPIGVYSFDLDLGQSNTGLSYPIIDRNYYLQGNSSLYRANQPINLTDIIMSVDLPVLAEEKTFVINTTIQNNVMGDEIMVSIDGTLFFTDGSSAGCFNSSDSNVGINSSKSIFIVCLIEESSMTSAPLNGACFAITTLGISYSNSTKERKTIPSDFVVCF